MAMKSSSRASSSYVTPALRSGGAQTPLGLKSVSRFYGTAKRSRSWLWLAVPLLLAACQTAPQGTSQGPSHSIVGSGPSQAPARPGGAPDTSRGAASSGAPLPATADLVNDPGRFKGLTASDVTSLLGPPSFQRHDGDAEIWQYYGPSSACVLDLFVYPDQGEPRVAHAELRSRGAGNATGCMAAILDGKRG